MLADDRFLGRDLLLLLPFLALHLLSDSIDFEWGKRDGDIDGSLLGAF